MSDELQKDIFSKNLNKYLELNNKSQKEVSDAIGVIPQTFNTWCTGQALPRMGKVQKLADYFGIEKSDLIENKSNQPYSKTVSSVRIPVLGSVPAGIPIEAVEDIIDYEEIDSVTASKGDYFALKIKGDSMNPRICSGDVVIVRKQDDVESGDVAIVMVNGNDATIKRVMKYADGIRLLPTNPAYEPLYFTNEEIQTKPVKVIGKVVENRQKY